MLSDEEKKATQRIDYIQDFIIENGQYNADVNDMEYFSKVLNLIEKQSKEIEELKQKEKKAYIDGTNVAHKLCNKKWGDIINAKIEEVDKREYNMAFIISGEELKQEITEILQSLLEKE